jgi:hypothetical protein
VPWEVALSRIKFKEINMFSYDFEISEVNNDFWTFNYESKLVTDRSKETVAELLDEKRIKWSKNNYNADILIFKENTAEKTLAHLITKLKENKKKVGKKYFNLIGEPVELTPYSWYLNRRDVTLSVAPGDKYERFFFASEWKDPQIDTWHKKKNKVIYIGRPTPDRLENVKRLLDQGINMDIYIVCFHGL